MVHENMAGFYSPELEMRSCASNGFVSEVLQQIPSTVEFENRM